MDVASPSLLTRFARFFVGTPPPEEGQQPGGSGTATPTSRASTDTIVLVEGGMAHARAPRPLAPALHPGLQAPAAQRSRDPSPVAHNAGTPQEVVNACILESVRLRDAGACQRALMHIAEVRNSYVLSAKQDAALLMHNGRLEQQLGHFDEAIGHYSAALSCDEHADDEHTSSALFQIAMAKHLWFQRGDAQAPTRDQVQTAFALASGALRREVEHGRLTPARRGVVVHNQGFLYEQLGLDDLALASYQEALRQRQQLGDQRGQGYSYHRLAIVAQRLGELRLAAEASAAAVRCYEAAGITGQPRAREVRKLAAELAEKLRERDARAAPRRA